MIETVIVIPARYGSTRFPGKPLAMISGKSLLERTWRNACAVSGVDKVFIATDDERVAEHATKFGAKVQSTPTSCNNGTERTLAALQGLKIKPEVVINLQGDAPLTPPYVIEPLVDALKKDKSTQMATIATRLSDKQYKELVDRKISAQSSGTLVTFDLQGKALYFSKTVIPFIRHTSDYQNKPLPIFKHIGIYGYSYATLEQYVTLKPTPLELAEGLEQLRALEHGIPIKVVEVDFKGRTNWSVDSPQDAELVEQIILKEGELV